jgi:hypothetical protein
MGLGPVVMGLAATAWGFSSMFIIDGVIAAAAILLYYFLHGRKVWRN